MSSRALIGLAAALVVLIGLAVFAHRGTAPTELGNGALFLPSLEKKLNDVDRVEVVRGGKEPVATLIRKQNNWVVQEKDSYPADIGKVRAVLLDLAEAHIVEQKTSNPEYYSRLGVESVDQAKAAGTQVTLRTGDMTVAAVTVGKEAGNGYRYVRQNDKAESYLVDKRVDIPRDAAKWLVPDIVDVRPDRVREVAIERPSGEKVTLTKSAPEQPNFTVENVPKGRELQYPGVADVTGGALRELRLEDVAVAEADAAPDVTTTYRTFDGLVVTVKGFEKDKDRWIELEASVDEEQAKQAAAKAEQAAAKTEQAAGKTAAAGSSVAGAPAKNAAASSGSAADSPASGASEAAAGSVDAAAGGDAEGSAAAGKTSAASDSKTSDKPKAPDPHAEAEQINARVHGWRYRIASYQYDQMTRRMEDLLKAEEKPAADKKGAAGK
ncbi:MAG TPA: DUF4340 domain-containing protein [Gammaproteobacteria bacterium]|nr:DUF4340 domain-containing protein [Gammaproteobacteria bacterium]